MAGHGGNWTEICELGRTSRTCMRYLLSCSGQGHIGIIWCTSLKMASNSKLVDHMAKGTEFWVSGVGYI